MEKTIMKKEYPVIMSNDLIKSKSNLSINEIKLLRLVIMQIVKEDTELKTYKVKIQDFAKLLKIAPDNLYRDVHDITKHLLQEVVEIGDGNPKHKWHMFQWCSSCSYDNGQLIIKLHDDLMPYLIDLKGLYTKYLLEDILFLKSVYSVRLYELLREEMRYQKVYADHCAVVDLSLKCIRKATSTEDKYEKISMFRKRVINIAVNEINAKLGYFVSYVPYKEGKKIIGFKFDIKSKNFTKANE